VDAVEELYLKAATGFLDPRQAAMNMVTLAQGSTLGLSVRLILCLCLQHMAAKHTCSST